MDSVEKYIESEDSGSDWDTTIAESLAQNTPARIPPPVSVRGSFYNNSAKPALVSQLEFDDLKAVNTTKNGAASIKQCDSETRIDITKLKYGPQQSPPPHMSSFSPVLSDYAVAHESSPEIPPRGYEGKSKLYTVPETESFMPPPSQSHLASWDDSDAEERVLKELQKNLAKDRQRQQVTPRERKVTLAGVEKMNVPLENQGFVASPKEARSNESLVDKWQRLNEHKFGKDYGKVVDKNQKCPTPTGHVASPQFRPPSRSSVTTPPLVAKDISGKKCVFYFEEGSLHFVEVMEDDVNAILPKKVNNVEKIFRRVWREVFAVLRVVTSIFVLFIVELILFLAHHIVRPLVLDSITAAGDYVLKPLLARLFNAVIQPIFALLWNIFHALYQASEPLVKLLGYILMQVAVVVKAFRLFDVQYHSQLPRGRQEIEII